MEQISVTINKFPEHNEEIYEAWKSCWTEVQEKEWGAKGVKYMWSYQQSDEEVYYVGINLWPSKESREAFIADGGPDKFFASVSKLFEEKTGMTM